MDNNYDELKEELKKQALDSEIKVDGMRVPDFGSMVEFRDWARAFNEKEIRKFSKKDWLNIYDKIDEFVKNNKEFDKLYQEQAEEFIKNSGINVSHEALEKPEINLAIKKRFFVEKEGGDGLSILNRNFAFDEEDFNLIRKLAKNAGEQYANRSNIQTPLEFELAIKQNSGNRVLSEAQIMNTATISQTNYFEKVMEGNYPLTDVKFDEHLLADAVAVAKSDALELVLNPDALGENTILNVFHESAHLHLQNIHSKQQNWLNEGVKAVGDFDDDFYKLMQRNLQYYIDPQRMARDIPPELNDMFSPKMVHHIKLRTFNSYHKQPMEKFSQLYGVEAERVYRNITKNYSERNAVKFNNMIRCISEIGEPKKVAKTQQGVNLYYKSDNISGEELEKIVKERLGNVDKNFAEMLNIEKMADGSVKFEVPSGWDFKKKLDKFLTDPMVNISLMGKDERKDKIMENEAKGNIDKAGKGEDVIKSQRVESAKNRVRSVIASVEGGGLGNVSESKLALLVEAKSKEVHEAFAQIDYTEEIGDLKEQAKQSIEKMQERLSVRGGNNEVKKEENKEAKAKKNGVISKAKEANDKFDNAIDRIIDKGSKKLNNTKVGKAYQKIEDKVLNSKAVKKADGVKEKALKWGKDKVLGLFKSKNGAKAVSKTTTKTASKVATKTAAKVGGKAVMKSIVKKIPFVSVVAGVGFGVERCFKGEWAQAGGEVLSGVLGCFPGLGTAASVAVDAGLAASDIYKENKSKKEDVKPEVDVGKVSGKVVKEIAERGEMLREQGRSEQGNKGEVKETKLSAKDMMVLRNERV